jgi:hypothetical protein
MTFYDTAKLDIKFESKTLTLGGNFEVCHQASCLLQYWWGGAKR